MKSLIDVWLNLKSPLGRRMWSGAHPRARHLERVASVTPRSSHTSEVLSQRRFTGEMIFVVIACDGGYVPTLRHTVFNEATH